MGSSVKPQLHSNLVGKRIAAGRLELVSVLGLGAYGVVYLARDLLHPLHDPQQPWTPPSSPSSISCGDARITGLYAVKCLHRAGLDQRQQLFQQREIALHSRAGTHPGVVTLYQVLQDKTCMYVVMDYCPDGDLFSMITENQRYLVPAPIASSIDSYQSDWQDQIAYYTARAGMDATIKNVFGQLVDAVAYCHQQGTYHRDLKPENILCLDGGERVVLADFGLATTDRYSSDFGCGSTFYMSPECQGGIQPEHPLRSYDTRLNDIWSLGVILVNLVCGRNPWKQATLSDETFSGYLRNHDLLAEILPISDSLNNIFKRIFTPVPEQRCTLAELSAMVQRCDRFTASDAELKMRDENRRRAHAQHQLQARLQASVQAQALAQAQAHAAPARAARDSSILPDLLECYQDKSESSVLYSTETPSIASSASCSSPPFTSLGPGYGSHQSLTEPCGSPVITASSQRLMDTSFDSLVDGDQTLLSPFQPQPQPRSIPAPIETFGVQRPHNLTSMSPGSATSLVSDSSEVGWPDTPPTPASVCSTSINGFPPTPWPAPQESLCQMAMPPFTPSLSAFSPLPALDTPLLPPSQPQQMPGNKGMTAFSRMVQSGRQAFPSWIDTALKPFPKRAKSTPRTSRTVAPTFLHPDPAGSGSTRPNKVESHSHSKSELQSSHWGPIEGGHHLDFVPNVDPHAF